MSLRRRKSPLPKTGMWGSSRGRETISTMSPAVNPTIA
jgi:hypothetical protein